MAKKVEKTPIRVSDSLYIMIKDNADVEHREVAAHCRYLIVKFIENYVTDKPLDVTFPTLAFKESNKTAKTILICLDTDTFIILEALMKQVKQKKTSLFRAILKHQIGYTDMADMPSLF